MPTPADWDTLALYSWDDLATWDDPLGIVMVDAALASGGVTRTGTQLSISWGAGEVETDIETDIARDKFPRTIATGGTTIDFSQTGQLWTTDTTVGCQIGAAYVDLPSAGAVAFASLAVDPSTDFDIRQKTLAPFATGAEIGMSILARFIDTGNYLLFRLDYNIDQNLGFAVRHFKASVSSTVGSGLAGLIQEAGAYYWMRAQGIGALVRVKMWKDGTAEPELWDGEFVDAGEILSGQVGFKAETLSGNTNTFPLRIYYADFMSGVTNQYQHSSVAVGLSYDDGMPSGASNTSQLGVPEMATDLTAPNGELAAKYWSTFRPMDALSPFADLDRDIARVAVDSGLVAPDGLRRDRLFTGQTTDIPLKGSAASLTATSRTRLAMSTLVQPPAIHGLYEGCEASWPVSYALVKSGVWVAPPVHDGCRIYLPMHGSIHPMLPDDNGSGGLNYAVTAQTPASAEALTRPIFVDSPHIRGVFAGISSTAVYKFRSSGVPRCAPGQDFWSATQNRGRMGVWVRSDPVDVANSPISASPPSDLLRFGLIGADSRRMQLGLDYPQRRPYIWWSDSNVAFLTRSIFPLPADGLWHFIGITWDAVRGSMSLRQDGVKTIGVGTGMTGSGALGPIDDLANSYFESYLPIADFQATAGAGAIADLWDDDSAYYEPSAIMRPSILTLEGLAEPQPREAYELISSYAQGELAVNGIDALDRFNYLPIPFWAEPEQQRIAELLSAETNVGMDLAPARDVKKIYNQITTRFKETTVGEVFIATYAGSSVIEIDAGQTVYVKVATSHAMVEIRGTAITVLTGAQITATPPSDQNAINYVTVNLAPDGSGLYGDSLSFFAQVVDWDPGSVTILLRSMWPFGPIYVTNALNFPSLAIAGKTLQSADAATISQDDASIAVRGNRNLQADLPVIQRREDAQTIGNELAARLARSRASLVASVLGDVRRTPGRVVTVSDPDTSGIEGTYRINAVTTTQTGADVQQSVAATEFWPVLVWGEGNWGETIWGP